MATTLATLRALHATIGSALDDIERVYNNQGLDFPSLDIPVYQTDSNAKDTSVSAAEALRVDPAVVKASTFIAAACGQLTATVFNPFLTLMEGVTACHLTAILHVLEQSNAVEILREAGPNGLYVSELARKIDEVRSGKGPVARPLDPSQLGHILRALASHHWLREVRPDVFANNRLSSVMDSGKTSQQLREAPEKKYESSVVAMVPMSASEPFMSMGYLSEWLLSPRPGTDYATPFNYANQTHEEFYTWIERPENALRLAQVGRAMTAARAVEGQGGITNTSAFPWDTLPKDAVVIDVGGGVGGVSVQLALAHPHLRLVVQDRGQTLALAPGVWRAQHPDLLQSGRLTFQEQDFFEPQPQPSRDAAVFILTRVLHNWSDELCTKILGRLRASANDGAKVVIVDQLLRYVCAPPPSEGKDAGAGAGSEADAMVPPPGSPLLPNLGKATAAGYHFDLTMMATFGGKERTLHEFEELARATGWKIERVARLNGSLMAYVTLGTA